MNSPTPSGANETTVPSTATVLIFSSLAEPCTSWVTKELERSGCEYVLINFEDALLNNLWSISVDLENSATLHLSRQGGFESLCRPASVWMRRWGYPAYPSTFDGFSVAFAFNEISAIISALPEVFGAAKWVNDQRKERAASNKIFQLDLARRIGFLIPPTLVTSDKAKVTTFMETVGRVVFKPVSAFQPQFRKFNSHAHSALDRNQQGIRLSFGKNMDNLIVFTQELTPDKLELLEAIRWTPVIFQKRIDKKADIRVTVVGDRIFSCSIDSQSHPDTETDFRMMNISGLVAHTLVHLPDNLEQKILLLMRTLGLSSGAWILSKRSTTITIFSRLILGDNGCGLNRLPERRSALRLRKS